jgi:hypothetical protein
MHNRPKLYNVFFPYSSAPVCLSHLKKFNWMVFVFTDNVKGTRKGCCKAW